jgi:hypothetical protein
MKGWLEQLESAVDDLWASTSVEFGGDLGGVWIGRRPGPSWSFIALALFVLLIFFAARR